MLNLKNHLNTQLNIADAECPLITEAYEKVQGYLEQCACDHFWQAVVEVGSPLVASLKVRRQYEGLMRRLSAGGLTVQDDLHKDMSGSILITWGKFPGGYN